MPTSKARTDQPPAVPLRWWEARAPARGPLSEQDGWFGSYASDCPQTAHPESVRVRYVVSPDVGHHFCAAVRRHKLVAIDVQAVWCDGERPSDEDVDVWEDLLLRCDVPDEDYPPRTQILQRWSEDTDDVRFLAGWDVRYLGSWLAEDHPDDGEQEASEAAFTGGTGDEE